MKLRTRCLALVGMLLSMGQVVAAEARKPLKVFILAGQSNM